MSLPHRIRSFRDNTTWLGKLMEGKWNSSRYIIRSKFKPNILGEGIFNELPLFFRKQDLSALREVLVDHEYAFLSPLLKALETPNILDLGAHIGTFAFWCLAANPNANILSIEADPNTFLMLKSNKKAANERGHQWKALNRAAWKDESLVAFSVTGDSMSHKISNTGTSSILGISLKTIIEKSEFLTIDLVKIDIEGAEEALLSADPEQLKRIKNLVIEIHPNLCNEEKVREILKAYYPVIEDVGGRKSSKPLLYCRKFP